MEAQIFPLAIFLDQPDTVFRRDFFYNTSNCISEFVAVEEAQAECLRLIDVAAYRPGHHLELVMDDEKGQAVAFFAPDKT
jgi:hypothetical protein